MEPSKEIRDRIIAAADSLYEQSGRAAFPTVDAVRKVARVNMNDASTLMKEWRRQQMALAVPVPVAIPDAVQQTGNQLLVALWQQAQELASESLRTAQAGWEVERAEAETLSQQLGEAYDAQTSELETALRQMDILTQTHQAELQHAAAQLAAAHAERDQARQAETALREASAMLRGQLDTLQEQNTKLLEILKHQGQQKKGLS